MKGIPLTPTRIPTRAPHTGARDPGAFSACDNFLHHFTPELLDMFFSILHSCMADSIFRTLKMIDLHDFQGW